MIVKILKKGNRDQKFSHMKKYGNKLKIELGTLASLTNKCIQHLLAAMGRKQEELATFIVNNKNNLKDNACTAIHTCRHENGYNCYVFDYSQPIWTDATPRLGSHGYS